MRINMFQFKQFSISDERCAMKVGTDGVLLGAWATVNPGATVWDVGAGSGLIGLMAAQRGAAIVIAFEIDNEACTDAELNIARSPWHDRIKIIEGDFAVKSTECNEYPDLIVSNPPFFTENLHSPGASRARARHEDALPTATIMRIAAKNLRPGGRLALVAPANRLDELIFEARLARLWLIRLTMITTVAGKKSKRFLAEWGREDPGKEPDENILAIRMEDNTLTPEYKYLTKDFYL